MGTLNLGIVAHVDAGKTTLTERLLHAVGVIDEVGSVDDGTTRTDSLALERQRGITIKSAVVSFAIDGLTVNLIDTPGHPDFIAEVERVLNVLDGAVLVVSAVEGVQAQTRVLMRTLRRLRIPTLVFVNKIDRSGARSGELLRAISDRLTSAIVPIGIASDVGTRRAGFRPYGPADGDFINRSLEVLADYDEELLAAYVLDETAMSYGRLRHHLATMTKRAQVYPVFFGSAITGAGVDTLIAGIRELLPVATGDAGGPVAGSVFKVERGRAGEKIAYVRVFSGTVRLRDRLRVRDGKEGKVTGIEVFDSGSAGSRGSVSAGQIAKLWGLAEVRIGDPLGEQQTESGRYFAPPTLETAIVPRNARDLGRLHAALTQLAEQDPLIDLRQDDLRRELYVSLYGEVQKEVIQATLADEYGIDVAFRASTTLCVERPASTGEAAELLQEDENPFRATIGLRIAPAAPGTGIDFRLRIDPRTAPTHLYRSVDGFATMMGGYVRATLREGLFGWQVTDCTVAMVRCAYSVADGPPSTRGPDSTPTDFRLLTPLVVMRALRRAGTVVCEPIHRFVLDCPADTLGAVLPALARLDAVPGSPSVRGPSCTVEGEIPAARVHALQQRLAALTRGEGTIESAFHRYQPVRGRFPTRPRTDHNPLNRKEYLLHVLRRVASI